MINKKELIFLEAMREAVNVLNISYLTTELFCKSLYNNEIYIDEFCELIGITRENLLKRQNECLEELLELTYCGFDIYQYVSFHIDRIKFKFTKEFTKKTFTRL